MSEKWTVKGRIVVDHVLPELTEMLGSRSAVGGITVKVSARSKIPLGWGTWNAWDTVTTGAGGQFAVTNEKGSDRRQFKVQILFDSSKLRIKEGQETKFQLGSDGFPVDIDLDLTDKDWHEVYSDKDTDAERRAGVHDLGDILVSAAVVRKHADAWILYNKVIDLMESYGAEYIFKGRIVMKYPMSLSGSSWSSYWNPLNGHGYIKEDQFNAYTLLHELTHKWEYDHCTGESSMAWQLAKHGDTHQSRENTTHVPFLETFADFGAVKILQEISGGKLKNFLQGARYSKADHPFSREYIGGNLSDQERNLANLDYTERGWYGLFSLLTFPYLDRIDVDRSFTDVNGEDSRYAFLSLFSALSDLRLGYSFKDVLSVFLTNPGKNIDGVLKTQEMNFRDFLNRAGKILTGLDAEKIKRLKSMLNPSPKAATATLVSN
jgi:hypothetical protein